MKAWLPLILFFLYIYVEIKLFILVASYIGVLSALILLILTSVLGFTLLKRTGINAINKIMLNQVSRTNPIFNYVAAILLIIPGFLTDIMGLLTLLPPIQHLLKKWFKPVKIVSFTQFTTRQSRSSSSTIEDDIIEGDFKRKD